MTVAQKCTPPGKVKENEELLGRLETAIAQWFIDHKGMKEQWQNARKDALEKWEWMNSLMEVSVRQGIVLCHSLVFLLAIFEPCAIAGMIAPLRKWFFFFVPFQTQLSASGE